ncbi:signal peptidase I [Gordonia sp. OPL2]|uniref:signal peptidase I n=1 Tax=Gordonia sp. OPL2 TaxID=2486274 RepID=UPI0016553A9D|nr:signal peptidase I [Gordonia sp. OPL2]
MTTVAGRTPPELSDDTSVWWWIRAVVTWVVVLAAAALVLALIVVPFLGGARPYTVLTSSMEPTYPAGTLVVVRATDASHLPVGTVVTYQLESGQPDVVTHRVIATGVDRTGERVYTTQGDANPQPDREPVKPVQIRGTLWYSIPYLGYVNNWLTGDTRMLVVAIAAAALFLYALWQFVGAGRAHREASTKARGAR